MDGCRRRQHRVPLGIACLVLLVIGNVHAEDVCRTGCKAGAPQIFKYAPGTTYKYSYDGKIEISLSSAEGQSTSTEVKADVLLTQLPECNQVLRIQNFQVLGSAGKKFGSIPDIEKPIRINNNDGVLEDSICVVDGDNQNSINVKRAIASIFQASLNSGYETDVFGRCPTEFSSHKEGNIFVVHKTRSLNKCSFREHVQQDFISSVIDLNSEIKSSPFLNGEYAANLRIKNGVLDQATVTEEYLYVPFSVGKNGAKAHVISKLQFSGTSTDTPQAPVTKPRSIIFEDPHPVVASTSNIQAILHAVKEVAKTVDVVVSENTAREFINLLKIVKVSSKKDLLAVYNQVRSGVGVGDKDAAQRLYLDALIKARNGDSLEAVLELLDKNQLNENDKKLALLSLSAVHHASEGTLKAATKLLAQPQLSREAYLGIGNLAGRFCRQHNCDNHAEVKALTTALLSKIASKFTNREQENDAIFALKGLRNFHYLNENVIPKITTLAQAKNLPNRVRVAALEAYLADPCKDKLRTSALQILQDIQQDSEVRIRAYLVVAQCPNAKVANAIKTLLTKEPSIQVGGFISSHLHALRSSSNPNKALAKQFLSFSVKRNFPIDPRKYSFNGEFSYAIDTLGIGASSEGNVIYSQNSWLPRSTSLNLTSEIFGHSLNFLEINTRQENLDKLVEHYFGPKGVLRRSTLPEFFKEGKSGYHKIAEYVQEKLKNTLSRSRRDVSKAEIDHIAKQVQIKTNELNKDLDVDLGIKLFGAEVFFLNVNQEAKVTPEAIIDKIISELSDGLDKLQRFEETLRQNLKFLDIEVDYPTSLGFPFRLSVEGSANLQVKAEGNVDVRQLINNPDKGELSVKLIPSANVEVSGRLTLDSLVVENGLKVVSSLYSSTGGDLKLIWDKTSGFDLKFGLPVQEQKLISASHEIVFITKEQAGRELNLPLKFTQAKDFSVCLDQLSPFIGLTFCAEVNGPNLGGQQIPILPFPLAGDAKIAVTIENDDVSEFHIKHEFKQAHGDFILETIGKNHQKKVSLDLQAEFSPERYIKAIFSSPVKSASVEAMIIGTNVEKSLLVKFTHDKDEFSGKVGVIVSGSPERAIYKPILEYKTPAGQQPLPVATEGQIVVERNGENIKLLFENLRISDSQRQFSINGNIGRDAGIFFSDLTVSDGANNIALQGRLQLTAELIKFNVKVQNSFNNNANFDLQGEFKRQPSQYESAIQLIHGPDLKSKTSVLTLTSKFVNKFKSATDFTFATKNSISYPLLGVSGKFELEQTPKALDYEINAEYGELKLGSELEAKINEKSLGDYEIEFEVWGLDNKLELKSRRQVLANDESKISNTIELNGKKFELEGKIRHNVRPHNIDVGTELTVHVPSHAAPLKVNTGLKVNQEEIDAYSKISSGSEVIVDSFLKGNRKGNANGALKVNLKNLLNINGQIHSNNGAGNGDVLIDLQNGKRQIKADTTFVIQFGRTYDITATLYPSFQKDKDLKILFKTQNVVSETSVDSRNNLEAFGHPLEINVKGSKTGDRQNGKIESQLEVTLLGDQYFLTKGSCEHQEQNDLISGQQLGSIEYRKNKNSPGRKYEYKTAYRNTNLHEGIVDADLTFSVDDVNGKNINGDVTVKSGKNGDVRQFSFVNKLSGSSLVNPFEVSVVGNCNKGVIVQYELSSNYGAANKLSLKGNHDFAGKTKRGSLKIQANSVSDNLKALNVDLHGSFNKPEVPNESFQIEGDVTVQADNAQGSIINIKYQGNVKASPASGEIKSNVVLNNIDPISVDATYNVKENKHGGSTSATVTYGKGETVKYDVSLDKSSDHQYKLEAALQTPVEGYKNNKLTVNTKRSKGGSDILNDVELSVDGKTWKANTELVLNELAPVVDVKLTSPRGKLQQFYVKANKISNRHFSGELKLICEQVSFVFDSSLTVNVENVENLIVKGQVNSPSLRLNKIVFEAHNKGSNDDRKIQIVVKTAGKNYISGNMAYAAKEENGKFIIDGSGNFKVKDESKSGNFKYIVERLETDKNGEHGVQISFDAALGNKALDSEYKLTNKQFRLQESYCEAKKECAYIEIDNKINSNDVQNFNQVLEVNLDLRKLGLPHEFGLKAVTDRKGWIIDHTVDAHFQNQENSKYQYSFFVHPTEAGISLTTPKRIVSLEAKTVLPKNFKEGGKVTGDIAFYMDKKNHANKKTALAWSLDVDPKGKVSGESKFTHPGLRKTLGASFKATRDGTPYNGKVDIIGELDVFAQENQKLVLTYQKSVTLDDAKTKGTSKVIAAIKSVGLGIDIHSSETISGDRVKKEFNYEIKQNYQIGRSKYENVIASKWSPNQVYGIVKVLDKTLLRVIHNIQIGDNEQTLESQIASYNNVVLVSKLEVKNYNTLAYSIGRKDKPNTKLLLNAGFIPGQLADVRADSLEEGQKVNLFYATLKLDEANFLKSDHKIDSKAIESVTKRIRANLVKYFDDIEALGKDWSEEGKKESKEIVEILKKASPNLEPLKQYYSKELEEFKNEILNDKSIQEFGEAIQKVFGSLFAAVYELFEHISRIVEEFAVVLQSTFKGVVESLEKELIPNLKELGTKLLTATKGVFETVLDIVLGVLAKASLILEQYQPELQELANSFGDLFRDIGKLIYRTFENAVESIKGFTDKISGELKASQFVADLKAHYQQFIKEGVPSADAIINTVREVGNTIKDIFPPNFIVKNDIDRLLDDVTVYIEKKLRNQPVDDAAALQQIATTIATIFKKVFLPVGSTENFQFPGSKLDSNNFFPISYLKNLPQLAAVKFSPLAYILDQDSSTEVGRFFLSLVDNPRNLIPPFPLLGLIVHGQHIFTFDGKYLTFPGKCNYLFARDAVNGNFTIAGSYKDGFLESVTLADATGGSITILQGGKIKAGQDGVELPYRTPTIAAWTSYDKVELTSTAGASISCTPDLVGCTVKVSGFYHGQVRGLLGNGNNEPYDDFTVPSGKIVTAEGQFGNAYKLASSCADVTVPKHDAIPENPICTKLFSWESSLRLCYPFVSTENFKVACAHGLAANVKRTEEVTAKAYVVACQEKNIPIYVPETLAQCTNSDKAYNVGDTFSVKLPSKAADIVLIVDTKKANQQIYEKLVKAVVPEINNDLHARGISDVQFHLITQGGHNQWPSHVTVNGKLTFKGKPPALKFVEEPADEYDVKQLEHPQAEKFAEQLKDILHDLSLATGMNLKTRTFDEAYKYPFRAHALKSIIIFNSEQCEVGKLYPMQKLLASFYKNSLISVNLFTPFSTLTAKDAKKAKDIVGFNDENVFTLLQAKKNPKGSSELHKELNYEDYCVDYVLKNRGNVFVNNNFLALNEADQKQYIRLAATNIADKLISIEQGLDCECKLVNPWNARNLCKEAYSKDRPSKKV